MDGAIQIDEKVIEILAHHAQPYRFPAPWAHLPQHSDILKFADNPADGLSALSEYYASDLFRSDAQLQGDAQLKAESKRAEEVLIAAGIIAYDADYNTQWTQALAGDGPVVLLRDGAGRLLGLSAGSVSWRTTIDPLVLSRDAPTVSTTGDHCVVVAFTAIDQAVLLACGVPTIPGNGLADLSASSLRRLQSLYRINKNQSRDLPSSDPQAPPKRRVRRRRLVLQGCSLATCSAAPTAGLEPALQRFMQLAERYHINLADILIWAPDSQEVDSLLPALRDRRLATGQLQASLDDATQDMSEYLVDRDYVVWRREQQLAATPDSPLLTLADVVQYVTLALKKGGNKSERRYREEIVMNHAFKALHAHMLANLGDADGRSVSFVCEVKLEWRRQMEIVCAIAHMSGATQQWEIVPWLREEFARLETVQQSLQAAPPRLRGNRRSDWRQGRD